MMGIDSVVKLVPADYLEDLFPSQPCMGFYLHEDGSEVFYSILPEAATPLDQITKYSEWELTQLAKLISGHHKYFLACSTDKEAALHLQCSHAFGIQLTPLKTSSQSSLKRRLVDPKWWRRNINKLADERREHLAQIERRLGKYSKEQCCSRATVAIMLARKAKTATYLANAYKVVSSTLGNERPTIFSLLEVSMAQQSNRINELFLDIKALERIADDRGWSWAFVTLTAHPRYHSNPSMGRNSFDPDLNARAANMSISKDWRAIQGALKERGYKPNSDYFGFRVVEVHEDGCPHWHVLLFHREGVLEVVKGALERLYSDRPANFYKKNQDDIVRVGRDKSCESSASPASYIFNYLAFALVGGEGDEDGSSTAYKYKCALRAMGARQYQVFGIKNSRGKLRALLKVKNKADCPENILALARDVHVDKEVEGRNQKQLDARVNFFLGGSDAIDLVKEITHNGFGERVEKIVEVKHREDHVSVQIAGLCEGIEKADAEKILSR